MISKSEKVLKALSDRNRLRIINMLSPKTLCVCEITDIMEISQSTVSGHLRILKEAGIVDDRKDGLWVEYSLLTEDRFIKSLIEPLLEELKKDKIMQKDLKKSMKSDKNLICK